LGQNLIHPRQALFNSSPRSQWLPVCDHYAGNERFLRKALALQQAMGPLFDVTADCEDGAPVGEESAHASLVGRLLADEANTLGRMGVRIHDLTHAHWQRDIELIMRACAGRVAYVTVPKVESAQQVIEAMAVVNHEAQAFGVACPPLHVLIESLDGLANVDAIASHPGVQCLSFGLMDFVSSFGGTISETALKSPGQFEHPIMRHAILGISMAAHRYGKTASHGVTTDIANPAQAAVDAQRAMSEFGFMRKWSIHPDQIAPIVRALQPSHGQAAQAAAILSHAQDQAWGPIQWQGRLHDRASYRLYWQLLQRAYSLGVQLEPAVITRFFGD
jgi:citrate lyase subunit beta / citryl-CoA lyase